MIRCRNTSGTAGLNQAAFGIDARRLRALAVLVGLLGTISSSLAVVPHQLAYFNEAAGGPERGHQHLLHSNLSWGQDFLFLGRWCQQHVDKCPLALYAPSMYRPSDLGLPLRDVTAAQTLPPDIRALAIDITTVQKLRLLWGANRPANVHEHLCHWIECGTHVSTAGRSLYIYLPPNSAGSCTPP